MIVTFHHRGLRAAPVPSIRHPFQHRKLQQQKQSRVTPFSSIEPTGDKTPAPPETSDAKTEKIEVESQRADEPSKKGVEVFSHAINESFATDELMDELKDQDGFGKRGEVVLLAQIVVILLVLFPPMQLKGLVYLCGILSLVFGAMTCTYAFIGLGRSFSPLVTPRKKNQVISSGMFQYMRHPLYAGLIWLAYGLAAVTYSETRFVLSCLLFAILNYKARKEEEAMLEKHGKAYTEYMQKLQRFVPTF